MKRLCSLLSAMILIAVLFIQPIGAQSAQASGASPQTQGADQRALPTNGIIVKFKEMGGSLSSQAAAQQGQRLSAAAGVTMRYFRAMSGDAQVWKLPQRLPEVEVQRISERLMSLPDVEYAEPDSISTATLVPDDTRYGEQWHYDGLWGINAPAAWDITTGLSSTVVAVIDTGITNHADLAGRILPGYDFLSDPWQANDGDGRDDNASDPGDWLSAGECGNGEPAQDKNSGWHGTHVAGTIGANSNNGFGVSGINWNAKLLPVRVLGKCGGPTSDIADGIRWAAGLPVEGVPANPNPARVLNLSLGGPGACEATYQNAINDVTAAGAIVVVAAGNNNLDLNVADYRPAECNNVITVGATAMDGARSSYSNYGATLEISAPGGDFGDPSIPAPQKDDGVLSTVDSGTTVPAGDTYAGYQGTSMATPHVAGVISLMMARNPNLTAAQVLQILQSTARGFPGGEGCDTPICGVGIVDAAAAVAAVPQAYTISGNAGVAGAILSYVDGTTNTVNAGSDGLYALSVSSGWSGTVTPSKPGYAFSPASRSYTNVTSDQTAQNYTAAFAVTFDDVPIDYWAWSFIERLYGARITGGCSTNPPSYCPEQTVTRAQMAVFLLRGIHIGTFNYTPPAIGSGSGFGDVPVDYWSGAWIKQLAAEGITAGCGNGNYCPEHPVTRAQMAVFLLKAKYGVSYAPPAVGAGTGFGDVPPDYWAAAFIKQLVIEGITAGCGSGNYCPETPVTRAQMAVFLVRTFNLP